MTISIHDKDQVLPGGVYADTSAGALAANTVGQIPDFSVYGPSLGKNPAAGSFIGFCFYPQIGTKLGYKVLGVKNPAAGQPTKVRVLLTDHPDGG